MYVCVCVYIMFKCTHTCSRNTFFTLLLSCSLYLVSHSHCMCIILLLHQHMLSF